MVKQDYRGWVIDKGEGREFQLLELLQVSVFPKLCNLRDYARSWLSCRSRRSMRFFLAGCKVLNFPLQYDGQGRRGLDALSIPTPSPAPALDTCPLVDWWEEFDLTCPGPGTLSSGV